MQNQKTTAGGLVGGLLAILTGVQLYLAGDKGAGITAIGSGLGILYGLWQAKDKRPAADNQVHDQADDQVQP